MVLRNPNELEEDGKISGSFNIPLPEVSSAFQMDSEDFKEKYGFEIPNKECENLIISCRCLYVLHEIQYHLKRPS